MAAAAGADGPDEKRRRLNLPPRAAVAPSGPPPPELAALPALRQRVAPGMRDLKSVLSNMFTGPKRLEGRVAWFNKDKGFGKISPLTVRGGSINLEKPLDVFVHRSDVDGGVEGRNYAVIAPGVLVTYEASSRDDGTPCAVAVRCEGLARIDGGLAGGSSSAGTAVDEHARRLILEGLRVGSHQELGRGKPLMEDRLSTDASIEVDLGAASRVACRSVGVFDGHAGPSCSEFVSTQLDKNVFDCLRDQKRRDVTSEMAMRSAILAGFRVTEHNFHQYANKLDVGAARTWASSGCTACSASLFGPDEKGNAKLLVANLGDSRAVLGKSNGQAICLTSDHTPGSAAERRRIEQRGGSVAQVGGAWRVILRAARGQVTAGLSVSRSFGDVDFKTPDEVVSPVPELTVFTLNSAQDAFIILATDGIWSNVQNVEAVRVVGSSLREQSVDPPGDAARRLVELAHQRNPVDDKTAVVVWFGLVSSAEAETSDVPELASDDTQALDESDPYGLGVLGEQPIESAPPESAPLAGDGENMFDDMVLLDDLFSSYARDLGVAMADSGSPSADAKPCAAASVMEPGTASPAPEGSSASLDPSRLAPKKKQLSAKAAKKIF